MTQVPNGGVRFVAVPIYPAMSRTEVESVFQATAISSSQLNKLVVKLLEGLSLSPGDQLALLDGSTIRALGTLTSVGPGNHAWTQKPVNIPSPLLVNPTDTVKELTAAERQKIWGAVVPHETTPKSAPPRPTRYWKIAPEKNAVHWPQWRDEGIAAIGWPALGDITNLTEQQFKARAKECEASPHLYKSGQNQVWDFRQIQVGDRIVANRGQRAVVGIGTVTRGYYLQPGISHPHRVDVRWDDVTPRKVNQPSWMSTLIELDKATFDAIVGRRPDPCVAENIILYGPPGTGKTHSTIVRALKLLGESSPTDRAAQMARFRQLQAEGRIEFVTFHQSYSYEEFIEGIRPVLADTDSTGHSQDVRYELHDGVFKRIAMRAAEKGLRASQPKPEFDLRWDAMVEEFRRTGELILESGGGTKYRARLNGDGLSISPMNADAHAAASFGNGNITKEQVRSYWQVKGTGQEGAVHKALTSSWNAVQLVDAKLGHGANTVPAAQPIAAQERLRKALDTGDTTVFEFTTKTPQYVLIIDEINRGNISKILGELITLLEPDKRLGAENELRLPLASSPQHRFAVPPNLNLLGTMNTADRSLALMDVALRRRFQFEELSPDAGKLEEVLSKNVSNMELVKLVRDVFEKLNARVQFLYDRDHQLGHALFMKVETLIDLRRVFLRSVIPLLQEYFYGAWDKIALVLGCPFGETGKAPNPKPILIARKLGEVETLGFDHEEYEDRVDVSVSADFSWLEDEAALVEFFVALLRLPEKEHQARLTLIQKSIESQDDAGNEPEVNEDGPAGASAA